MSRLSFAARVATLVVGTLAVGSGALVFAASVNALVGPVVPPESLVVLALLVVAVSLAVVAGVQRTRRTETPYWGRR